MEPTEENLKNTENAFKDMYSRLHNVPRDDLEDIPVEELTNLESSLVNRANKIRFKEIKAVNTQNLKKEDLGKKEYSEEVTEKIVNPEEKEVKTEATEKAEVSTEAIKKSITPISEKSVPDVTDLDKKLKAETAMLPEPPLSNKPVEAANFSPEQEQSLRREYPFFDFDKKPVNDNEAKWLDQFKKDLLAKMDERKVQLPVESKQNIATEQSTPTNTTQTSELSIDQEQALRTEYPFFDFDKKPVNDNEAKWLDQFKKDLLSKMEERKQPAITQNIITEQLAEAPTETSAVKQEPIVQPEMSSKQSADTNTVQSTTKPFSEPASANQPIPSEPTKPKNISQFNIPEPMAATIESLKSMNIGNINEMIDQMTAIAMGFQKNAPINEAAPLPASFSESSLKSINDNIANLNKINSVSTKELKSSIDSLRAVVEQILSYLPNIQSGNMITSNTQQPRDVQQVNTGLIQRYKNEVRQQYGSDIIDLSNNRPTMPGFTI
jgi:hypothetical protein